MSPVTSGDPIVRVEGLTAGPYVVTADLTGTIKIWEDARKLTSKSAAAMTLKGHAAAITHLGFSSAGKQLVSTSADKTARVWEAATGQPLGPPLQHQGPVRNALGAWNADGAGRRPRERLNGQGRLIFGNVCRHATRTHT